MPREASTGASVCAKKPSIDDPFTTTTCLPLLSTFTILTVMTADPAQPFVYAVGGRTTMVRFTYPQAPLALRLTPPPTRCPPSVSRKSSFKLVSTKTWCIMHSQIPPIYPSARSLLPERRLWSSPRAGEDSSRFGRTGRSGYRGTSWDARPISTLQEGGLGGRKAASEREGQQDMSRVSLLPSSFTTASIPSNSISAKTDEISDPGCWCFAEPKLQVDCASPKGSICRSRNKGRRPQLLEWVVVDGCKRGWSRCGPAASRSALKVSPSASPRINELKRV